MGITYSYLDYRGPLGPGRVDDIGPYDLDAMGEGELRDLATALERSRVLAVTDPLLLRILLAGVPAVMPGSVKEFSEYWRPIIASAWEETGDASAVLRVIQDRVGSMGMPEFQATLDSWERGTGNLD